MIFFQTCVIFQIFDFFSRFEVHIEEKLIINVKIFVFLILGGNYDLYMSRKRHVRAANVHGLQPTTALFLNIMT